MPYQKNPDTQPGKANQSNIAAQENQATGGAQLVSFTQKPVTAYGPGGSNNVAFDAKGLGIVAPVEATSKDLNQHKAGVSSATDLTEVKPSSQSVLDAIGISAAVLPMIATPTISPTPGSFDNSVLITLACATSGVVIRYTLDGSTPSATNGLVYSVPFAVSKGVIVSAYATKVANKDSQIVCSKFVKNSGVASPVFSPSSGIHTAPITITTATGGATIKYTIDGSTPTQSHGTVYTAPIALVAAGTVKAIAYKTGNSDSAVVSASYT